uniref:RAB44, member RAS oncogene family n=1 Tax=Neolamprologus brichardi TaxID=32507 RepID=A0A3Q4HH21_NEOBR
MGSTRRNKEELHQKQEVDNEAKETGTDIGETKSVSIIKEEALQLHTDHKNNDSEQGKQKVFETVEISPPGQSKFKPLPEQTVEERPVSQDQLRYNVVMIGDSSVGKTSFMKRAQSGKFSLDIPASIGLDSLMWPVVVDGKPMILQLWDTAGQERFHSITKQVFHKAQAFLLMYDITSTNSFSAVSYWANCIQESAAENVTVLLLGNKSDCSERRVKTHQGEILAKEYDFEFMECSAATGENVIQSLEVVARKLSQRIDSREEATVLHKEPEQKKSSRCC